MPLTKEKTHVRICACGCGKKLDIMLSHHRKFWYGHEKIGKDKFWFHLNHPPKCLCGCGGEVDWDPVNLMWKDFHGNHGKNLDKQEIFQLKRERRRDSIKQRDLFPLKKRKK